MSFVFDANAMPDQGKAPKGKSGADDRWYVVRTKPGAQLPRRKYIREPTRGPKGYRIVATMSSDLSAIERALGEMGFAYYMPTEKRLLRDRRRPYLWKHRRFALLVGYVFVHDPRNIDELEAVPGVAGILRHPDGRPMTVPLLDILRVRTAEAKAEAAFHERSRDERHKLRRAAKIDPSLAKIVAQLDIAGTITVKPEDAR